MHESRTGQRTAGTPLATLATIGGIVGLLAGLWILGGTLADGGWGLLVGAVVLVLSLGELAFAYGAWTRSTWAEKAGRRAAGFAVAMALVVVGVATSLTIPVRTTVESAESPITEAQ